MLRLFERSIMSRTTWEKAWQTAIPQEINAINDLYKSFTGLKKARSAEDIRTFLASYNLGNTDISYTRVLEGIHNSKTSFIPTTITFKRTHDNDKNLSKWIILNFSTSYLRPLRSVENALAKEAGWFLEYSKEDPTSDDDGWIDAELVNASKSFMKELDSYMSTVQDYIKQLSPKKFSYKGFPVYNAERMAKPLVHNMLQGIEFLTAFFKNKGMLKVFEEGIRGFVLHYVDEDDEGAIAYFDADTFVIGLYAMFLHSPDPLSHWMKTNLVHEFGHYIHTQSLNRNARRYWDSFWDRIDEIREIEEAVVQPITPKERRDFLNKLAKAKYNLKRYRPKDVYEQMRFTTWLLSPNPEYLSSNKIAELQNLDYKKMPKLTPYGKKVFSKLSDYENDPDEAAEYRELLGAYSYSDGPQPPNEAIRSVISPLLGEEDGLIEALEAPTDYAETNRYEDFAETFARYMTEPNSLSSIAKYRLQRTLSLSGLYGKPVMRLSSIIEKLLKEGMSAEAKEILEAMVNPEVEGILQDHVWADGSLENSIKDFKNMGDKILYLPEGKRVKASDLRKELESWRPTYVPGDVIVYHSTDRKSADFILRNGVIPQLKPWTLSSRDFAQSGRTDYWKPGSGLERGLYVSTSKNTSGYGPVTLALKVPFKYLDIPAEAKLHGYTKKEIKEVLMNTEHGALIRNPIHPKAIKKV